MRILTILQIITIFIFVTSCSNSEPETFKEEEISKKPEISEEIGNKKETEHKDNAKEDKEVPVDVVKNLSQTEEKPMYVINSTDWKVEPIDKDNNEKLVLLTIDDAPDKYSLEMAKTLKNNEVKAIFFVNGHFIQSAEKKAILKEIYDLGFSIGNHTMTHTNLNDLTEEEQYNEIIELNHQIEEITGEKPRFFRAPFGSNTDFSKKLVAEHGMVLMNWTYGYDWEKEFMNKDALADIMVNTPLLTNGANLLMHDREWTNDALQKIIEGLQEKSYKIVDPKKIKTL
ncbi:polysaccharide deacetylase family protein [Metabacillus litoralis]|uniref:Polysaccharide deacetylase family protein n=1 Tax=Metabacillus litoralis TaxID=152268 RepID=A0A5C6W5F3_9BACI|nr:polysaccharide deacetylase family protein [Metabacillus litoralis]TXC92112.1 polysaccharide deacetylase family protein [Metabacillus litoralis]